MTVTSGPGVRAERIPPRGARAPRNLVRQPAPAGRFRLDLATSTWTWSDELVTLFGLPAGVPPGVDLLLARVHPDEQTDVLGELAVGTQGGCSSAEHRLRRSDGTEFVGTLVVTPESGADGVVTALSGLVVPRPTTRRVAEDPARIAALETEVEQLRTAMSSRAQIEQAKGVLMLLTGFTEQACFDLLGHISSHTHRKVRDLSGEIVASASGGTPLPEDIRVILRDACPPRAAAS